MIPGWTERARPSGGPRTRSSSRASSPSATGSSIAITLLVLPLGIRSGLTDGQVAGALFDEWDDFLAFAISFAVIGRFWLVHHRFFGEVTAFDGRLIGLNMVYLACVVLIPFSSEVLGRYGGATASVVMYSINLALVVLTGWAMAADARRAGLASTDAAGERQARVRATYISGIFLLSIPVAFVNPHIAPYLWLALFFDPASRASRRRRSRGPGARS
jgi:uncharacterized membrane protein